jgi:hypothetical protein
MLKQAIGHSPGRFQLPLTLTNYFHNCHHSDIFSCPKFGRNSSFSILTLRVYPSQSTTFILINFIIPVINQKASTHITGLTRNKMKTLRVNLFVCECYLSHQSSHAYCLCKCMTGYYASTNRGECHGLPCTQPHVVRQYPTVFIKKDRIVVSLQCASSHTVSKQELKLYIDCHKRSPPVRKI